MNDETYTNIGKAILSLVEKHIASYRGGNFTVIPIQTPDGRWIDLKLEQPYRRVKGPNGEDYILKEPA